jgi:hypothetical protein
MTTIAMFGNTTSGIATTSPYGKTRASTITVETT